MSLELTDAEKEVIRELRKQNEKLMADDLALVRENDYQAIKRERSKAIETAAENTGITTNEAEKLSLTALWSISGTNGDSLGGTPDPSTGDPERGEIESLSGDAKLWAEREKTYRDAGMDAAAEMAEKKKKEAMNR